nr:type II secretion system F family protein [Listeria floridensis]
MHYSQVFARECGYLLKSGLSVQKMLQLFISPHSPVFFKAVGDKLLSMLERGYPLANSANQLHIFEPELIAIIQHGEKNATIAEEMLFYYDLCHQKMMDKTEKLFSWIQPVAFLIIGLLIVSIYLSILFPMFSMVDQI